MVARRQSPSNARNLKSSSLAGNGFCSQAGMECLWDIIHSLTDYWHKPKNAIARILEEGEPAMFEAVWKMVARARSTYYKVRRWLGGARR